MINCKYILYIFILSILFSCKKSIVSDIDKIKFQNDKFANVLGFDLTRDELIKCGLIVQPVMDSIQKRKTIILPFKIKDFTLNEKLSTTYGSFNNNSIIDFSIPKNFNESLYLIRFRPNISDTKDKNSAIYLIKDGLKRRFIYIHKNDYRNDAHLIYLNKSSEKVNAIGVVLPNNVNVGELRNKANSLIKYSENQYNTRFIDISTIESNDSEIEITYHVEPTTTQQEISDFLLKVLGILFVPFLQLIFMDKKVEDERKKRFKKWFLIIGITFQIIVFTAIGVLGYFNYLNGFGFPSFDLILILLGTICTGIVLWMKSGNTKPNKAEKGQQS